MGLVRSGGGSCRREQVREPSDRESPAETEAVAGAPLQRAPGRAAGFGWEVTGSLAQRGDHHLLYTVTATVFQRGPILPPCACPSSPGDGQVRAGMQ